jgi:hypothetical protein
MIDVAIVLHQISTDSQHDFSLPAGTYIDPTPNITVNPIFCFVGICRPQMVGIGIEISMTSVTIPMTAVAI